MHVSKFIYYIVVTRPQVANPAGLVQTGIVLEDPASWGAAVVEGINPEGEHWDKE
jgi:hypothetical protein